jgi:hypothetical protein
MAFFRKSFIFMAILVVCMSVLVSSTKVDTGNNVCKKSKKDLGDGTQNPEGQCKETFMGEIPDTDHMISTEIISPRNGQSIPENKNFTIEVKVNNLKTGFFSDPAKTYYKFPQTLDNNGVIQGHSHVTIQRIDENFPNAKIFAFFKGLNEKAKKGSLFATVDLGLKAGNYRLCTMSSAFSHQPALMPVAQRGNYLNFINCIN